MNEIHDKVKSLTGHHAINNLEEPFICFMLFVVLFMFKCTL